MDYKEIKELIKEMNKSNLTKLEIEKEGYRISMEKLIESPQSTLSNPVTSEPGPILLSQEDTKEEVLGQQVLSPMVGTFYGQPAPDKDSYVRIGDKVKKGQTLCIIEAMKLMNEIESEYDGEIVDILIESEEMVEYGQPLFVIA